MILLDTHVWVWWVAVSESLTLQTRRFLDTQATNGIGISIISCWEVAKLVEVGRLTLTMPTLAWLELAIQKPELQVLNLTPEIVVASTELPDGFHKDPADQLIVATARVLDIPLLTLDGKIRSYPHVDTLPLEQ